MRQYLYFGTGQSHFSGVDVPDRSPHHRRPYQDCGILPVCAANVWGLKLLVHAQAGNCGSLSVSTSKRTTSNPTPMLVCDTNLDQVMNLHITPSSSTVSRARLRGRKLTMSLLGVHAFCLVPTFVWFPERVALRYEYMRTSDTNTWVLDLLVSGSFS